MPEHEAPVRGFYDHESDEQLHPSGRRRRPAADWGVGEDIFDRMPSRRFGRRPEHREDAEHPGVAANDEWGADEARDQSRRAHADDDAREWHDGAGDQRRVARRPSREHQVETWDDDAIAAWGGDEVPRGGVDVERRTIVFETGDDEEAPQEVATDGRRTIVISGHPDRLPAPRAQRPSRTAVDRIGARPDRIVGYTVALGVLLILIAILTT